MFEYIECFDGTVVYHILEISAGCNAVYFISQEPQLDYSHVIFTTVNHNKHASVCVLFMTYVAPSLLFQHFEI